MRIRTFLVDDEQPARARLKQLLVSLEDVEVVGEAADGDAAIRAIDDLRPDLIFLDIQMPGRSGLEVASALGPPRPSIVFCTAFDEFAIRAFELHALDYLLKPVSRARLVHTVDRIRRSLAETREMLQDLDRAREIQRQMFPRMLPELETLDYAGACVPARQVGGDYYDFLPVAPHKLALVLADVCGKGVAAGLLMASVQGRLQSQVRTYGADISGLLSELNRNLMRTSDGSRFVTLFYGVYDDASRTLSYVNAGHNPPLVIGGTNCRLDRGGPVLGSFDTIALEQGMIRFREGDTLVIFSDGITEARNAADEEFGESRLHALTASEGSLTARQLTDRILQHVAAFADSVPGQDDRTVIVAKVR